MKQLIITLTLICMVSIGAIAQSSNDQSLTQEKSLEVKLKVSGMTCAGCASHLYKVLKETKGVIDNHVEYPGDIAIVTYNPDKIKPEEIVTAIESKTTYRAQVYTPSKEKR